MHRSKVGDRSNATRKPRDRRRARDESRWRSVYLWSVTASILESAWLVVMPSTAAGISSGVYPLSPGKAAVAVNPSNGRQYVFWLGSDERIHEAWYNGGWRGPRTMSWRASSAPAVAVSDTSVRLCFDADRVTRPAPALACEHQCRPGCGPAGTALAASASAISQPRRHARSDGSSCARQPPAGGRRVFAGSA